MAKTKFIFGIHNHQPVLALMDDTEKFGLWPGSWGHCYGRDNWLERFFTALEDNSDWLEPTTFVALAIPTNFIDANLTVPTPENRLS